MASSARIPAPGTGSKPSAGCEHGADLERSRRITYEQWSRRGLMSRVLEILSIRDQI